jgi:hypothetical protein
VIGDGLLRRFPGYHPARSTNGFARHISPSLRNTAAEYRRSTTPINQLQDRPELPRYQLTYVRHYVCWRALKRRGPGQNLKLAAHYEQRWNMCIARVLRRMEMMNAQRDIVLGGSGEAPGNQPLARPPWQLDYGQMDRY